MVVLHLIGYPLGQGGHINSLLNLSASFSNEHTHILIAVTGEKAKYFRLGGMKVIEHRRFSELSFTIAGAREILSRGVDTIHAHDYRSLKIAVYLQIIFGVKLIFTKAGGKPLQTMLPSLGKFIVYSHELLSAYAGSKLLGGNDINLIRERISMRLGELQRTSELKACCIYDVLVAMRMTQAKMPMMRALIQELTLVENKENLTVAIAGDGPCLENVKSDFHEMLPDVKVLFLGQINDLSKMSEIYGNTNLVVGHGRGLIEGILHLKPPFLLNFEGDGSCLVEEENIVKISHYNFSGRNFQATRGSSISLAEYLNKEEFSMDKVTAENYQFIDDNYNSKKGAAKLESLYCSCARSSRVANVLWCAKKLYSGN